MRTSVELPDPIYREMKIRAANEGTTIREIILEGVTMRLRGESTTAARGDRPRFPVIRSRNPGSLKLAEEGIYEYIPFP